MYSSNEKINRVPKIELVKILESWHHVHAKGIDYNKSLIWCLEHCEGKFYDLNKKDYYFQNKHDATMFALKWGS